MDFRWTKCRSRRIVHHRGGGISERACAFRVVTDRDVLRYMSKSLHAFVSFGNTLLVVHERVTLDRRLGHNSMTVIAFVCATFTRREHYAQYIHDEELTISEQHFDMEAHARKLCRYTWRLSYMRPGMACVWLLIFHGETFTKGYRRHASRMPSLRA